MYSFSFICAVVSFGINVCISMSACDVKGSYNKGGGDFSFTILSLCEDPLRYPKE